MLSSLLQLQHIIKQRYQKHLCISKLYQQTTFGLFHCLKESKLSIFLVEALWWALEGPYGSRVGFRGGFCEKRSVAVPRLDRSPKETHQWPKLSPAVMLVVPL